MKSKIITIYLPQFHEIPENNEWWGKGFTEWTNVRRGKSFYPGHYQPRIPYGNDYYDLSDIAVLEKHCRIAQKAKLAGFAFYHYYFEGKKLLEKPIENYRDYSKSCFPYCLIWANQPWARTWYRADEGKEILQSQTYGEEKQWIEHFGYLLSFFRDTRYIKIDNKPVYIIYVPQEIANRKNMFKVWNRLALENGFNGIYLIAMNTGSGVDHASNLYDAYMNFEPLHCFLQDTSYRKSLQQCKAGWISRLNRDMKKISNYFWSQNAFSYSYLCRLIEEAKPVNSVKKTYFGAFSGWDNTSRKDEAGWIVRGSTPKRFGKHIKQMLIESERCGNEYLFLNAWNEWSEGAYIEPDEKYKYAYLDELRRNIEKYEKSDVVYTDRHSGSAGNRHVDLEYF